MFKLDFKKNEDFFATQWEEKKEVVLNSWGIKWQEIATDIVTKKNIVDTGALRQSLDYEVVGDSVHVGAGVDYAKYHEFGTSTITARPYAIPAIKDHSKKYYYLLHKQYSK